jgi:hypothetical protein
MSRNGNEMLTADGAANIHGATQNDRLFSIAPFSFVDSNTVENLRYGNQGCAGFSKTGRARERRRTSFDVCLI